MFCFVLFCFFFLKTILRTPKRKYLGPSSASEVRKISLVKDVSFKMGWAAAGQEKMELARGRGSARGRGHL